MILEHVKNTVFLKLHWTDMYDVIMSITWTFRGLSQTNVEGYIQQSASEQGRSSQHLFVKVWPLNPW